MIKPGNAPQNAWHVTSLDDGLSLRRKSSKLGACQPRSGHAALQLATCNEETSGLDLSSLPAPAIQLVFHHLDCSSGLSLACSCSAYAAEFALLREAFMAKCIAELTPILSLDEATESGPKDCYNVPQAYGQSNFNPVSLHVWWRSNSAMRRMYALRHEPNFLEQIWQRAWPINIWSELVTNGLPASARQSCVRIHVKILIESDKKLVVPWKWLYGPFTRAPYDALDNLLGQHEDCQVGISLHRPAEHGKYQEVVLTHFVQNENGKFELEFITYSMQSHYDYATNADAGMLCEQQQQVAVTGRWCHRLPVADTPLWRAQQGCTDHPACMTSGDCLYEQERIMSCNCKPGSVSSRSTADLSDSTRS